MALQEEQLLSRQRLKLPKLEMHVNRQQLKADLCYFLVSQGETQLQCLCLAALVCVSGQALFVWACESEATKTLLCCYVTSVLLK